MNRFWQQNYRYMNEYSRFHNSNYFNYRGQDFYYNSRPYARYNEWDGVPSARDPSLSQDYLNRWYVNPDYYPDTDFRWNDPYSTRRNFSPGNRHSGFSNTSLDRNRHLPASRSNCNPPSNSTENSASSSENIAKQQDDQNSPGGRPSAVDADKEDGSSQTLGSIGNNESNNETVDRNAIVDAEESDEILVVLDLREISIVNETKPANNRFVTPVRKPKRIPEEINNCKLSDLSHSNSNTSPSSDGQVANGKSVLLSVTESSKPSKCAGSDELGDASGTSKILSAKRKARNDCDEPENSGNRKGNEASHCKTKRQRTCSSSHEVIDSNEVPAKENSPVAFGIYKTASSVPSANMLPVAEEGMTYFIDVNPRVPSSVQNSRNVPNQAAGLNSRIISAESVSGKENALSPPDNSKESSLLSLINDQIRSKSCLLPSMKNLPRNTNLELLSEQLREISSKEIVIKKNLAEAKYKMSELSFLLEKWKRRKAKLHVEEEELRNQMNSIINALQGAVTKVDDSNKECIEDEEVIILPPPVKEPPLEIIISDDPEEKSSGASHLSQKSTISNVKIVDGTCHYR